ncbi:site-specific recombinase, phage integrase [Mycolicibacterium phlei RIVM601174]|nr:site-specific recombinase, phage integrase [Mycolicibacterium phlei RIVM601174]MBF4190539.1 site-specific recombinase, phage integrase [Mycolicibacterium phlei]
MRRWVIDPDGERRQVRRRFETAAEAGRFLDDLDERIEREAAAQATEAREVVTVAAAVERWLAVQRIAEATRAAYQAALAPVVEALGDRDVRGVKPVESPQPWLAPQHRLLHRCRIPTGPHRLPQRQRPLTSRPQPRAPRNQPWPAPTPAPRDHLLHVLPLRARGHVRPHTGNQFLFRHDPHAQRHITFVQCPHLTR